MAVIRAAEEPCIIISQCGNVTLMGLGLVVIGCLMAGIIVALGQVWMQQSRIQDAVQNAVIEENASGQNISQESFVTVVEENSEASSVEVLEWDATSTTIHSVQIGVPLSLWFWPSWMGGAPKEVISVSA